MPRFELTEPNPWQTEKPPFTGENPVAIAYKQVHDQPTPLNKIVDGIPRPFEAIVAKLLARPMNVFSDAIARGENVDDLAVHLDQLFASTPRRGVMQTTADRVRRRRSEHTARRLHRAPQPRRRGDCCLV